MREIKFRVWDEGMMVPWDDLKEWECNLSELNELRFLQYTGLKDKNGKEIYEGDVVDICRHGDEEFIYQVIVEDIRRIPDYFYGTGFTWSEVVGNIYENQELCE
jgi:hypothetical protein